MLKALLEKEFSGYRECVKFGKTPRYWQTGVITDYSDIQERRSPAMYKLQRDITIGGQVNAKR